MATRLKRPFEEADRGWCGDRKRGAGMGRSSSSTISGKVKLQRVPLRDGGCYDPGGAYWGGPSNLWCAWNDKGEIAYLRAWDRVDAKQKLPGCVFYR